MPSCFLSCVRDLSPIARPPRSVTSPPRRARPQRLHGVTPGLPDRADGVLGRRVNLRITGYFSLEGSSERQLVQTRSVVSSVAKIVSALGVKGGQRGQFSKCGAELLPRGARVVRAFESPGPRAETGGGSGTRPARGTHGKFRGVARGPGGEQGGGKPPSPGPLMSPRPREAPRESGPACSPRLCPPGGRCAPSQGYAALHPSRFGSDDSSSTRVTNFIPRSFPQAKSRRKQAREQTQTNK